MELTVACRVCQARFSARLPRCPACGLERPAAQTHREVEEFKTRGYPVPARFRPLPAGSALGLGILFVAGLLLLRSQEKHDLLLPALGLAVAGAVILFHGLRRARRRAHASSRDSEGERTE